ncbi:Stk1 family PASTA domain-containing Ser/Thr kinase [Tissierella sp.]|uniref:Stk1 family PASTA domain-containing Ser/Thr kinase n=1 Tax=Tissierella sp. TaxID=41274 RepID=UPI002865DF35|nr:Stk1 family PASTA domain-containing Ser/Thr kinase [Tissierella sp.]MDR7856385.1 Stk1 family PASTA domain-containing Ser/Thr kinase [Tissierella sp.]
MIGRILGGRYEILEQIGGGGMALVYKAKCQLLDRFVAIKILRDEFVNDEEFVRKFKRESQAAASLSHPNIVNIYDVGVETEGNNNIHYIVMEYIKGKTLKEIIRESGKLSMKSTLDYTNQIAGALQHAHKNHIVHRDIKPHNIMITDDGRIKVTDFGIARAATSSTVTTTSNVLGSVHYFSPEQARGGYTDEKSDIYSLGIVMYEMVTGELPYQGESPITVALKHVQEDIVPPKELDGQIPDSFQLIILKCVQKRQADRYSNITELIMDLNKIKNNVEDFSYEDTNNFDSHTKVMPAVNIKDVDKMKNSKDNKKSNKKDGSSKVIFLGILLAFLAAASIWIGAYRIKNFFDSPEIIVPSVIGLQEDEAREEIEGLGLRFSVKARVKNSQFKAGEVISQEVDPDTKVKKNYEIEVTVSEGDNLIKVPSFVNKDLADVEELVKDADLKMGNPEYKHSDDIPENVIMSQEPESGAMVEPGTRIVFVVSKGEEIKQVIMPKLVGESIESARAKLTELDLVEGEIKEQPSEDIEKGIVTWQSYDQGTELETKTAVDLYVSSGPSEGTGDIGGDNDGNENNEESSITFNLTPLQEKEETQIKVIRNQDGVSIVVYNKKHSVSDGEAVITLQGKVGSTFDIYYDDIYQTTIPKNE